MKNPLVSVVVPVFNAEKYLPRCIKSILEQTYINIELLLINDGSGDRSAEICDDYAAKDDRVKVIHKDNGGVSAARNRGMDESRGEFIVFVDSDDWIEKTAIEYMVATVFREKTEIVMMSYDNRNNKVIIPDFGIKCNRLDIHKSEAMRWKELFEHGNSHTVWGKLFSSEIIKEKNIRFDLQMTYGEDVKFLFDYLNNCEKIYVSDEVGYHYNKLNENAATRKYHGNLTEGIIKYHISMVSFIEKLNISQSEKDSIIARCAAKRILNLIYPYVYYLPEKQALKNIEECLIKFDKWIGRDDAWKYNRREESRLVNAIFERDVARIYTEQKKLFKKFSPKQIVSDMVYKILRPITEKKRDGLVRHKFN